MIDMNSTGIYIAYPTTSTLKSIHPPKNYKTKVNNSHTKIGIAKRSFSARKMNYMEDFDNELNFIPIVKIDRVHLEEVENTILSSIRKRYKTVGYAKEWFDTDNRDEIIQLIVDAVKSFSSLNFNYEVLYDLSKISNTGQKSKDLENNSKSKEAIQPSGKNGFEYTLPDNYQFDEEAKTAYQHITVDKKPVTFLTGRAGTGKTTFIHYVKKNYTGNSVILTPTGMTALNIGGQTLNSFFRFPPRTFESEEISSYYNKAVDHLELIIIDEISMVQSDTIDHIDFALRKWRKSSTPFAGIQLLLIGDCFQLSPWIKFGAEKQRFEEKYRSQWFFDANVFNKAMFALIVENVRNAPQPLAKQC